jgi:hypothetical protein
VLGAIDLDNELALDAHEIDDVSPDHSLAAEPMANEASPYLHPEPYLCLVHVSAVVSGELTERFFGISHDGRA